MQNWIAAAMLRQPASTPSDFELGTGIPFSFIYDGVPSAQLLPSWKRTYTKQPAEEGKESHVVTYADPVTGLKVSCELTRFADYPAAEWVLHLRNTSSGDTPVIEDVRPLDLQITVPPGEVVLHHAYGSIMSDTDFLPIDAVVRPHTAIDLPPREAPPHLYDVPKHLPANTLAHIERFGIVPSQVYLPYVNLEWQGGGIVGAIGWCGQWALRLVRDGNTGLTMQAGQQLTHLRLHPGESIRTPRILILYWQGDDRLRGHNLLRRLLLAHYTPRIGGEIVIPPVYYSTTYCFGYSGVTEQNQVDSVRAAPPIGVECFSVDAGWFKGGWPHGTGSWEVDDDRFPHGLKPVSDAVHAAGMAFELWFEPERVTPTSLIAQEHPEWVLQVREEDRYEGLGGLFNLGDPPARTCLPAHLSHCIAEWGVDIYRQDRNRYPLPFWRAADAEDRQGIAEIRHVEGLYTMWDGPVRMTVDVFGTPTFRAWTQ